MECRYEIQVGAVVRVLADQMATREQKEFFRHVLARHKIILAATGATKLLNKVATGEKESVGERHLEREHVVSD